MEKIEVNLLGRDVSLACKADEKERLVAAIEQADQLMNQIKENSPPMTNERVALMACIQLSSQILSMKSEDGPFQGLAYGDFKDKINEINKLLDYSINRLK